MFFCRNNAGNIAQVTESFDSIFAPIIDKEFFNSHYLVVIIRNWMLFIYTSVTTFRSTYFDTMIRSAQLTA